MEMFCNGLSDRSFCFAKLQETVAKAKTTGIVVEYDGLLPSVQKMCEGKGKKICTHKSKGVSWARGQRRWRDHCWMLQNPCFLSLQSKSWWAKVVARRPAHHTCHWAGWEAPSSSVGGHSRSGPEVQQKSAVPILIPLMAGACDKLIVSVCARASAPPSVFLGAIYLAKFHSNFMPVVLQASCRWFVFTNPAK